MQSICFDDPNEGMIQVTIGNDMKHIDACAVFEKLLVIQRESENDGERSDKTIVVIEELGFPRVTSRVAVKFANAIIEFVENLEKKVGPETAVPAG